MKAVLISIKPKWWELIEVLKKTIEVRKTCPNIETPFKVYVYETKDVTDMPWIDEDGHYVYKGRGKVVGEFVCDEIAKYPHEPYTDGEHLMPFGELEKTCLDGWQLYDYLRTSDGYGWHITDVKKYPIPKELSEFRTPKNPHRIGNSHSWILDGYKRITRPPQSWCYVEGV